MHSLTLHPLGVAAGDQAIHDAGPLLMAAVFVPVSVLAGIVVGQPALFIAVAVFGAIITIPIGYTYVGLVVLLREYFGPRQT